MLRVTNKNNFTLKDRYDGIDYEFKPNTPVVVDEDAARHFFGFGIADKTPFMVRQGWCVSSDKTEEAKKKLNNFVFEVGKTEFVSAEAEEESSDEEEVETLVSQPKTKPAKQYSHQSR